MVDLRPVHERDVDQVVELYRAVYGDSFPFREFYDTHWIKKGVFSDDIEWIVAERGGRLIGSAAVMTSVGDTNDLIGEFGRLVVHPDAREGGLGSRLMADRIAATEPHLEFGFAECRTAHPGAQKIMTRLGFAPVGVEPLAYALGGVRESVLFVCRLFGNARALRKNNPHVVPEVHALGCLALRACGLDDDLIVEHLAEPYPVGRDDGLTLEELDDRQVYRLLRLNHQTTGADVFGGMRLEYGFLKLKAHQAQYLVIRQGERVCGGLGYVWDTFDAKIRVFELLAVDDCSKGALLEQGLAWIEARHDPAYIQIDVNAHSPRMQRTLDLLGFAPVAYCPAMVYTNGERVDVVKMVKLRVPLRLDGMNLIDEAVELGKVVSDRVAERVRGVELDEVARRVRIFQGLTDLQVARIGALCREVPYEPGETIFERDSADQALFVVLEGGVDILMGYDHDPLAQVGPGEIFGELALIDEMPRSASARASAPSRLLVVRPRDFQTLVQRDPELGTIILGNIARTLAQRLRETNAQLEQTAAGLTERLLADPPASRSARR